MMRVREFGRGGGAGLMQASICSRSDVYAYVAFPGANRNEGNGNGIGNRNGNGNGDGDGDGNYLYCI